MLSHILGFCHLKSPVLLSPESRTLQGIFDNFLSSPHLSPTSQVVGDRWAYSASQLFYLKFHHYYIASKVPKL